MYMGFGIDFKTFIETIFENMQLKQDPNLDTLWFRYEHNPFASLPIRSTNPCKWEFLKHYRIWHRYASMCTKIVKITTCRFSLLRKSSLKAHRESPDWRSLQQRVFMRTEVFILQRKIVLIFRIVHYLVIWCDVFFFKKKNIENEMISIFDKSVRIAEFISPGEKKIHGVVESSSWRKSP